MSTVRISSCILTKHITTPHSLESVFSLFASPEFIEEKYTTLDARNVKIKSVKLEDTTLLVDTRREVPASEDTPSVIKKFIGEWNRTRQKEEWTKAAR